MQGDVYHLVFNLCEWLDGRVWPKEDELEVMRLVDLIHHVTGAFHTTPCSLKQCARLGVASTCVSRVSVVCVDM